MPSTAGFMMYDVGRTSLQSQDSPFFDILYVYVLGLSFSWDTRELIHQSLPSSLRQRSLMKAETPNERLGLWTDHEPVWELLEASRRSWAIEEVGLEWLVTRKRSGNRQSREDTSHINRDGYWASGRTRTFGSTDSVGCIDL